MDLKSIRPAYNDKNDGFTDEGRNFNYGCANKRISNIELTYRNFICEYEKGKVICTSAVGLSILCTGETKKV